MNINFVAVLIGLACLSACSGNPPIMDSDGTRKRADAAYSEMQESAPNASGVQKSDTKVEMSKAEAPEIQLSNATFRISPTVLVTPAMTGKMFGSVDVIRRNPLAKTAMEVINAYLANRGYSVVGLETQAQIDEVVQLQSDIAGNDEDLSYVAGLSVGADISITYAGSIQNGEIVIDLNATEASTANLLASESVRMKVPKNESQRVTVQRAMELAIVKLENKVRERVAAQIELGDMYKVIVHLTGEFTDDQAEEISNVVSLQVRKKFNKMQVISMSRNTYDLMVYVDSEKYEDAQMVYGEFVEALSGLAKVRKQNITKKLIILEIK